MEHVLVNSEQIILIEDRKVWGACEECGHAIRTPLPVTPVYLLDDVCKIIPVSMSTLKRKLAEFDKAGLLGVPIYFKFSGLGAHRRGIRSYEVQLFRNYFTRCINPEWDPKLPAEERAKKFIRTAELYEHDVRLIYDDPPLRWRSELNAETHETRDRETRGLVPHRDATGRRQHTPFSSDDERFARDIRTKLKRYQNRRNGRGAEGNT